MTLTGNSKMETNSKAKAKSMGSFPKIDLQNWYKAELCSRGFYPI